MTGNVRLLCCAALVSLAAPLAISRADDAEVWPGAEWERADPAASGLDAAKLERALRFAAERSSKAVVVVHRGRIVAERYEDGWTKESTGPLHSATKSVMAVLLGAAIEDGAIEGLDQPSAAFLREWQGTDKARITIRHHLTMTTGLELGNPGAMILKGILARDERAQATGLAATHPPGTVWGYHNPAYRLVFSILEEATKRPLPEWSRERLFDPIGMRTATFARKRFGKEDYQTLECSARDLARFGLLVLRKGRWRDRQLVPAAFIEQATRPSQELNPSYGYLFWLNAGEAYRLPTTRYEDPPIRGHLLPDCPRDTIAALGAKDQKLYIIPSLDLIVVRLGDEATTRRERRRDGGFAATAFDNPFLKGICDAVPKPAPRETGSGPGRP